MNCQDLVGQTIVKVEIDRSQQEVIFMTMDGQKITMLHGQECCENVMIEEVLGDLDDLIGVPLLEVKEEINEENPKSNHDDCFQWTTYTLTTSKGIVIIQWYGESNGYYSVGVDLWKV